MTSFWDGFEKRAAVFKGLQRAPKKIKTPVVTENVLDYAKINKPKSPPAARTLDYSSGTPVMKVEGKEQASQAWRKKMKPRPKFV